MKEEKMKKLADGCQLKSLKGLLTSIGTKLNTLTNPKNVNTCRALERVSGFVGEKIAHALVQSEIIRTSGSIPGWVTRCIICKLKN
jgi:hypothetical protein